MTLEWAPYSVLLPLAPWESADVVAEALASIARQTLPASQVVVSCDGPPSTALATLLQSSDLPLEVVVGPGGEGVGPVLARGLVACQHELVVRCDADDLCLPHRCEQQVRDLLARPELAALSAPLAEFHVRPDRPSALRRVPHGPHQVRQFSRWRNPLNHPSVILRRPRVLAVGNYRCRRGFEDYDLWLRLLRSGAQLDNGKEVLVLARVGPAHLERRRGLAYARREAAFLWSSGQEGLLSWPRVALLAVLRLPLRLLPAVGLDWVIRRLRGPGPLPIRDPSTQKPNGPM